MAGQMTTTVLDAALHLDEAIQKGAALLAQGELVVFPTETVYGLGADALNQNAVEKIFLAKGRPQDNPLIVHVWDKNQVFLLAHNVNEMAIKLMDAFWPGPLSLILERSELVPDVVSAGLPSVAVRMPDHNIALRLIQKAGVPVAAPSANTSGKPSPTLASHVLQDLGGKVPLIIDGGACRVGVESTVVDVRGEVPIVLRPGGITPAMIQEVAGSVLVDENVHKKMHEHAECPSPGMKYKHYSPDATVKVFMGEKKDVEKKINSMYYLIKQNGGKPIIFCADDCAALYAGKQIMQLGKSSEQVAATLYRCLREADAMGMDAILFHAKEEMGLAVLNRIIRAAGENPEGRI